MSRLLGFAVFLSIMLLIVIGVHTFFWFRLIRATQLPSPWRWIATIALVALAVSMPLSFFIQRALPTDIARWVLYPIYFWMGLMLFLLVMLVFGEAIRFVNFIGHYVSSNSPNPHHHLGLSRGIALASLTIALSLGIYAMYHALTKVVIKQVHIAMPKWSAEVPKTSIAFIADLHLGPTLGCKWLNKVVDQVNALHPDVIAIGGDLVDGTVHQLRPQVELLTRLKAKHGIFFITGNHEYYSNVDQWIPELQRLGIRVLNNERVRIGSGHEAYELAGVNDWSARNIPTRYKPDLAAALAGWDQSRPLVLLAHQPREIFEAAAQGVDVQLSGHTHGGQFWPWNYFVYLQQPYLAGLVQYQKTKLYISDGTGFWGPPMRLGSTGEITLITLTAAPPQQ